MAVVLRLARHGQKKRAFYRIVAAEKQCRRYGRFIEVVGTYNPMTESATVTLNEDRVRHWIGMGAQTTRKVQCFISSQIPGLIEDKLSAQRQKVQENRRKRKERAKARKAA